MTAEDLLVSDPAALADVVARARAAGVVAIDTEFVWERTYYPRLGLVQLAWDAAGPDDVAVALLDAPALDLAPLGTLLADPDVVKVLHDATQDLTILRREAGADPTNVFDTQRAAGFVGLPATLSLQDLLREVVGVEIEKGEQRTDWLRRPLSAAQLVYAAADVRSLPEVRRRLLDRAHVRGRTAWIAEEMHRYEDASLYAEVDPFEVHDRVKVGGRLTGEQRAVLRELAAWREGEARQVDRPRRTVLPDEVLGEVARRMPGDAGALARLRLPEAVYRRHAEALLDAVARGRAVPSGERPYRPAPTSEEERFAARTLLLQALVAGRCARQGVDAGLVASKADLRAIAEEGAAASPDTHALLQGWRRAFIGYDLLAVLDGRAGVTVDPEDGWPRFRADGG